MVAVESVVSSTLNMANLHHCRLMRAGFVLAVLQLLVLSPYWVRDHGVWLRIVVRLQ